MKRVVVTGIGIVSPLGCGVEHVWQRLLKGDCGISVLKKYDDLSVSVAGVVPTGDSNGDFNDRFINVKTKDRITDLPKFISFARYASDLALQHANLYVFDKDTSGVSIGTGIGAIENIIEGYEVNKKSFKRLRYSSY
jgi:3-oxoacyl-[acyl-carrier-protein] synthase II